MKINNIVYKDLSERTLFLSRLYLDLYLTHVALKKRYMLRFVAAACLLIASKIEDDYFIQLNVLVFNIPRGIKKFNYVQRRLQLILTT